MKEISAVVPAAGKGSRMDAKVAKPYLFLKGKPILAHTLLVLESMSAIGEIIVVVSRKDRLTCQREIINRYCLKKVKELVIGGMNRTQSVYNGLKKVDPEHKLVLVHDGIRPFITEQTVKKLARQATTFGAAISAVPVVPTIKETGRDMLVSKTLSRDRLWIVQTPQVFKRDLLWRAYQKAHKNGSASWDDAAVVEKIGHKVKVVKGKTDNIKITTPEDLLLAEVILKRRLKITC